MSKFPFEADPLSWKVTRFFLLLQVAGTVSVVGLCLLDLSFLALTISLITLFSFVVILLWLYARYRELPLLREKRKIVRLQQKFQKGIQADNQTIQASVRQRAILFQAEKAEIQDALQTLQKDHLENGLAAARVQEAAIPGIGPRLKERLAGYGILNAAQLTERLSQFPGVGEAKFRALMDWRASILTRLESTQPHGLPHEQLEAIKQKYQALQDQNDAAESKARASRQLLEHELTSFEPRIRQLAPLTFLNYLSQSLASRGTVAVLLASFLVVTQVVSSVSATASTASSILASLATETATATVPHPPTGTSTLTRTSAPTLAASTHTATAAPSRTHTAVLTATLAATLTPLAVFPASDTPVIPVSGNCDPSYPGVCIPPAPPDLDCGEVADRNFQVLPPDPHNFDRDGDGFGCEN